MQESANLRQARTYWINGQPIPVYLAIALREEGYDVEALESLYL